MGGERDSEGSVTREHRVDKMAERVNSGWVLTDNEKDMKWEASEVLKKAW